MPAMAAKPAEEPAELHSNFCAAAQRTARRLAEATQAARLKQQWCATMGKRKLVRKQPQREEQDDEGRGLEDSDDEVEPEPRSTGKGKKRRASRAGALKHSYESLPQPRSTDRSATQS